MCGHTLFEDSPTLDFSSPENWAIHAHKKRKPPLYLYRNHWPLGVSPEDPPVECLVWA